MTTDEIAAESDRTDHTARTARNRSFWDDHAAAWHGRLARDHWAQPEPRWGLWATPESALRVFPADLAGRDVIELGCGTAYVSAWLARAGARPVGLDVSREQLATARTLQAEFGLSFPLVLGDAEHTPYPDDSFDLAISEYGASLWCDPHRWIPEAARLLRPGGRLVFLHRSPLFALCAVPGGRASAELRRPQFGRDGTAGGEWGQTEFTVPHGEMVRVLRGAGFVVEDLVEIQAPLPAHRDYGEVDAEWAHRWPSEELWRARLAD